MKLGLVLPLLVALLFLAQDDKKPARPEVGKPAPAFRLNDHTGVAHAIGGKSEDWTVVAFYPKAMTPGCTKEVCSLRDSSDAFETIGVKVFGISLDSVVDQAKFHEQQKLNFPLLSDPDGSAARKYAVLGGAMTNRVTFVIAPDGTLAAIEENVQVGSHGEDLIALVEKLQG
jgi:peroxiredoxin Q/BCP